MWKLWKFVDFRMTAVGFHLFFALLAFAVHFACISSERFNWLEGAPAAEYYMDEDPGIWKRTSYDG
ncbi:hypothetical protein HH1059_06320 [Halorhodospira halochloris]|uniref:Antenna complex alpha/beta subunit domain-containing protein n=1 Tax=Halorhodospira halochloris TaxID=1052 RepID=A0A0X8XBE4_HALHR|nr:light-harvesting antenna LH1, alpha subunit [Halorhodospira halochloris]BAU58338.1 hypothetical protein HH1059_16280 [Halorhodospira halochloris]BBE11003.1 hypothetical protein HH1059_06320 [Halorhodospira halochloris]